MDGSFGGGGGRGPFEMVGTVVEWDGTHGQIITTSGERVALHRLLLKLLKLDQPIKVGDQIRFWATKRVRITYEFADIGQITPKEPDATAIEQLRELNRRVEKERGDDDLPELPTKELTGIVDSYDTSKGYGFVACDGGERVMLNVTCLRASGYTTASFGSRIRFEAIEFSKGLLAFRILSLEPPIS